MLIMNRTFSLAMRVAVATAWAACLVMLGLWFLLDAPRLIAATMPVCRLAGLSAIAAGLFVFMYVVADGLFPSVGQRSSMYTLEMSVFAVFVLSFLAAAMLFIYGGP